MGIFLIVVGGILTVFNFLIWFPFNKIMNDPKEWDDLCKLAEEKGSAIPQEKLYSTAAKIRTISGCMLVFGLFCLAGGIVMQVL